MKISGFRSQQDNQPQLLELEWDDLVASLTAPRRAECALATCLQSECSHKAGTAWSPAVFDGTRAKSKVTSVSCLVVDIDHASDEELTTRLAPIAPYRHIVHGSHSDRPGDRCLRVVLAVSRPVTPDEWPRFWIGTALKLGGDASTRDASRLYYAPSRPHDACHEAIDGTGYLFFHADGLALDVDAIVASVPADAVPTTEYEAYEIPDFKGAPPIDAQEQAALLLGQAWPARGRHSAHLALSGALARGGWPIELIAEFCAGVAEVQQPGNSDIVKRMGAARSSFEKVNSNMAIKGWPSLVEYVGEDVVDQVTTLLGFPKPPRPDEQFVAQMAQKAQEAQRVAQPNGPSTADVDAALKSAQKRLASRKDPESLKDAEYLKRVNNSQFLTDDVKEDRERALAEAAIAVARAAPPGTAPELLVRKLLPSAGSLAEHLPEFVSLAMHHASTMPPILARMPRSNTPSAPAIEGEFEFKDGVPVATSQRNFRIALQKLGIELRYNEFAEHEVIVRDGRDEVVEDHHVDRLAFEFEEQFNFYPPPDKFNRFVTKVARENAFHPPREYLQALPQGEFENLTEEWLIRFAGAEDSLYTRAVSRIVLVAAVRRIRQPGCLFQEMLILETPEQGKSKSRALCALAVNDEWFTDEFSLHADSRKMMETTSGKWIIEAGELRGMSQGDHNALKQYLSRRSDRARLAYGRKPREIRRQFIVIGTTNDLQYLKDQSGNRRYWPVRVKQFDVEALTEYRDRLWAEAVRLDLENAHDDDYIRLDPSLYDAAAAEQEQRKVDDPFQIRIEDVLGGMTGRVRVQDVWKLLGFIDDLPSRTDQMQIAASMQGLGWSRRRPSVDGDRGYYYERGSDDERRVLIAIAGHPGSWQLKMVPPAHTSVKAAPHPGVTPGPASN